ncbi:MAG: serine hydrolase [Verrucomicrobiota bacterium]
MKYVTRFCATLLFAGTVVLCHAAGKTSLALPRSAPEAQGVSSAGVLAFVEAADQIDAMNSFMLVRHGRVVAEGWWTPYDAQSNHELYSLSKSFTSTAVGIAVAEGKLSVDDEVLKFFPDDAPAELSANLKAMRVRDLLSMSAGHQDETPSAPEKISAKSFLAHPVPHLPGTHFKYNTPATFMQSAIVQKLTGQSVLDYLRPRLFEPLGIGHPVWNTNFQGISLGGYGLRVRTEDIAKFGQLYLQKGKWEGRQLIPAAWVEAATGRQVSNGSNPKSDWNQGYGYQFWRCRHNAYRGDGAFGQYCIVLPEQDAVIAITSGVKDMQAVMNLIWDKLLPALQPRRLAADSVNRKKLEEKLAHLTVRTAEGQPSSPIAAKVLGKKFTFPMNDQKLESITLMTDAGGGLSLAMQSNGGESRFPCGYHEWKKGRGAFGSYRDEPIAASIAWVADDTCVVKLCAYETPFYSTIKLLFDGAQVFLDSEQNVGFGSTKRPQLVGQQR